MRSFLIILLMIFLYQPAARAQDAFLEMKGTHFVVRYLLADEQDMARQVLSKAEQCYESIIHDLGFTRYANFWTWDKRVNIVLYPDQIAYARFTGQAQWSKAYATRESRLFHDRAVVTFVGQPEMFSAILPHEIAHLVLWDILSNNYTKVPVWFEEGVAQMAEDGKAEAVKGLMNAVVAAGQQVPFGLFMTMKPAELTDDVKVAVFYAQSLSVVVFLIEKYGQDAFYRLSKELRDGRDFLAALSRVYSGSIASVSDLEALWLRYISGS